MCFYISVMGQRLRIVYVFIARAQSGRIGLKSISGNAAGSISLDIVSSDIINDSAAFDDLPFIANRYLPSFIMFIGRAGSGKTASMTMLLKLLGKSYQANGVAKKTFSNYWIDTADYVDTSLAVKLTKEDLGYQLHDGTVALDEVHRIGDRRRSMNGLNVGLAQVETQTRKLNIDLLFTTNSPGYLDWRILDKIDYFIEPYIVDSDNILWFIHDWKGAYTGYPRQDWPPKKSDYDFVNLFSNIGWVWDSYHDTEYIYSAYDNSSDSVARNELVRLGVDVEGDPLMEYNSRVHILRGKKGK